MSSLVLRSGKELFPESSHGDEDAFEELSPLGQIKVLRGIIEHITPSLSGFMKIALGDPHGPHDKGLRQFDSVMTLGPDVTWADRVSKLIPTIGARGRIGGRLPNNRWIDYQLFLRSDGRLLEAARTSEIRGVLICNTTPLEVSVSVMSDNRLVELIAPHGQMKTLFQRLIEVYRAYVIDEFGRVERAQKLQEFCAQFRFLVSKAHLEEH